MFKYLALTIAVELPIYFLFDRKNILFALLILTLANCVTWPILNILFHTTQIPLLLIEIGVALVEAFIIYIFLQPKFTRSLLISIIQNAITTALGIYLNQQIKLW